MLIHEHRPQPTKTSVLEKAVTSSRVMHSFGGNIMNLYPANWTGCITAEVIGRRWVK
jgi:hypothetical protein